MSNISIETKKFTELLNAASAADDALLLFRDGNGVKTITVANFKADLRELINTKHNDLAGRLNASGAGAHNAIYRGKSLGTAVTVLQRSTST